MKKLEAVVRPERITVIRQRLQELGVSGMTILDANGWSKMRVSFTVERTRHCIRPRSESKIGSCYTRFSIGFCSSGYYRVC